VRTGQANRERNSEWRTERGTEPETLDEIVLAYAHARRALNEARDENARLRNELQQSYIATIEVLADAVEAKDAYTHGHCRRVLHYTRQLTRELGLSGHDAQTACFTALLHDVGKIGVSDTLLHKPAPLLPHERTLMQAHVRLGHDLLAPIPSLRDVANAVLYHHEWYDGSGYPDGLSGDRIPLVARIIAVIDAYCAMIDERPYRPAHTPEWACDELRRCAGTQFDPRIVAATIDVLRSPPDWSAVALQEDYQALMSEFWSNSS
jgi:HD-GYP domain-containing protein (c-di-GMP phosphodiesterase class II)